MYQYVAKTKVFLCMFFFETMRSENWGFNLSNWLKKCLKWWLPHAFWRKSSEGNFVKTCISGLVAWKRNYSPVVCWLFWKTERHMLESKLSLRPRRFSEESNNQHLRSSFRKLWCFWCPGGVAGGQSARSPHSARTGALSARAAKENEESEDSDRIMRWSRWMSAVKWMLKWMSGLDH